MRGPRPVAERTLKWRMDGMAMGTMKVVGYALAAGLVLSGSVAPSLAAQSVEAGRSGPREVLDRDWEIALARSAAPAEFSADATVLVWSGDGGWVAAVQGSNGATCYVARDWPESLEPHCFDDEGSRTILPVHLKRMEQLHAGMPLAEIEAAARAGVEAGTYALPARPAVSYMMSSGQQLVSDDGRAVGAWKPHMMIYFPYLDEAAAGGSNGTMVVVDPRSPFSNLMVPVPDFVDPVLEAEVLEVEVLEVEVLEVEDAASDQMNGRR